MEEKMYSNKLKGYEKLLKLCDSYIYKLLLDFQMAAYAISKQETNQGFYHLSVMLFKQVFSFAKIENLP